MFLIAETKDFICFRDTTLLHVFIKHTLIDTDMPFPYNGGRSVVSYYNTCSDTQLQDEFTIFHIPSHSKRQLSEMLPMDTSSFPCFFYY